MGREKAWELKRKGQRELEAIVAGKFGMHCETEYAPVDCGYLIVTEVFDRGPRWISGTGLLGQPDTLIFRHEEPALEFPSDHLKTKLLMIVG